MPRFALIGPDYVSQSPIADCELLMNLILEPIESGQGKSAAALYNSPGLLLLTNLQNGQGRGIWDAQGRIFCVIGTKLWELSGPLSNLNTTNWSTIIDIVSDGNPACMASGPSQLLIASAGHLYCFDLNKNALTEIAVGIDADGNGLLGTVAQVRYDEGFFYALIQNSDQIQQSSVLDGSIWPGVAETQVSVFPDNVIAIFEDHLVMWAFSAKKIQPYQNDGNFPFALDVVGGTLIEQGLAAPNSIAKIDNSIFWLGADERGQGMVWRANGYNPQRISNFALEYELNNYPTISDAVCYAYQEAGHTFYVMNFPAANTTRVYDCSTGTWSRRSYFAQGIHNRVRAGFHVFSKNLNAHIVLDPNNGNVYQQSLAFLDDAGSPIKRIRRAPHISTEQLRIKHKYLQLDLEVGLGPNFKGLEPPTTVPILDAAGNLRELAMQDNGILSANLDAATAPSFARTVFMNDPTNVTSWQLAIDAFGKIQAVPVTYRDFYPQAIPFITMLGDQKYTLQVANLGNGFADFVAISIGPVLRGPRVMLRWSDDGGKTWSNEYQMDCGLVGNTIKRVKRERLGISRDRVYEISMTDACFWRIIDGYLFTSEDQQPQSRYSSELRKRA